MKLYLDTISGISADMLLAALLATGELSFEEFETELRKFDIPKKYQLDYQQVTKGSIGGYAFKVIEEESGVKKEKDEQKQLEEIEKTRYKTGHGRWKNSYGKVESRHYFRPKNRTRYDVEVQLEDKREEKNRSYLFRTSRRYRNELIDKEEPEKKERITEQEKESRVGSEVLALQEGTVKNDSFVLTVDVVKKWIKESKLEKEIREKTIEIFDLIVSTKPEGSNISKREIRFDEMIQVVGTVIWITKIGVNEIYVSVASEESSSEDLSCGKDGSFFSESSNDVKITSLSVEKELGMSVGDSILKSYHAIFVQPLNMKIKAIGVGCGEKESNAPGMLKAVLFEEMEPIDSESDVKSLQTDHEKNDETINSKDLGIQKIMEVQCAMEDMTGEELEYAMKKLGSHSMDICLSSVLGKNLNPGYHLKVFCTEEELVHLIRIIFSHTTAAQVYTHEIKRYSIVSKIETIETELGKARLKIETVSGNIVRQKWDHRDLVRLAEENNMNLREVQRILWRETLKK